MDSEEIVKDAIAAWNTRDQARFVALFDDDCELIASGYASKGHTGVRDFWDIYMRGFPDNQISVVATVGNRDFGVQETVFRGTNTGSLRTADGSQIPPTEKQVSIPYAGTYHFKAGKISRIRYYFDQIDLLSQLGLMPA
jgi:steroid delta-isomerase-like uncharacterized protein